MHPLWGPAQALAYFSQEPYPSTTLFNGQYVPATRLPWAYLPTYIALALPELVLLLLLAAPLVALLWLKRTDGRVEYRTASPYLVVGTAIVFPVAYAIAVRAVLFDGMRHFIFVLPPIAALTAALADRALDWMAARRWRRVGYAALALYGCAHLAVMARLHPDEYVFYNAFIGGVEGAAGRFKLDYWGNSYAEAVTGLKEYLEAEYGADFADHDFLVGVCGPPISALPFFAENFIFAHTRQLADFYIAFTKDGCDRSVAGKEVYRVERLGVLLSRVIDRRDILRAERELPRRQAAKRPEAPVE